MQLDERLKVVAQSKSVSQNQLAVLTGFSQSYINEVFRGAKNPTVDTLKRICDAMGVTLAEFFCDAQPSASDEDAFLTLYRAMSEEKRELALRLLSVL